MRRRIDGTAAAIAVLLATLVLNAGCAKDESPELLPLPEPVLDRLEPAVSEKITAATSRARSVLADREADAAEKATAVGQLGRLYHAYELFDAAITCYRNAERLQPGEAKWSYLLARALHSNFLFDPAREAYERALAAAPGDPAVRLAMARLLREQRSPEEARRLAEEVRKERPDEVGALLLLAELATDRGDSATAIGLYERLLELQPKALRLHQPLAMALRAQGLLEQAREHQALVAQGWPEINDPLLGEVQALAATSNRAVVDRGVAAYRAGDYARAAEDFAQAVAADPTFIGARTNLGSALARLDRFDEAAEQFKQVIALEPDHVLARFNLGVIATKQGRVEEAIRYYEDALGVDPRYRDARYNLANALRARSRGEEALAHYLRILDEDPGHAPARVGEWLCLLDQGRGSQLRQRIDAGLVGLPDHTGLLDAAARLLAATPLAEVRDGPRALALAERLVATARSPRHLETLGMALAEVGRYEEAATVQRESIAAAEAAGQRAQLEALRANLRNYESAKPCRDPAV